MEDKLIEYTDKIVEALEAGVDFAGEQAPLLIQEVLSYYLMINTIWGLIFVFVGLTFTFVAYKIYEEEGYFCEPVFGFLVFSGIPFLISMAFWTTVIKITIAPRLFLIEKLSELL